jgi:hypothetical protein
MHIPFLPKLICPNSQGYGANLDTRYISSSSQAKLFTMSKLPSCERNIFKSFINILKAYRLDQQRSSNIEKVENVDKKHK